MNKTLKWVLAIVVVALIIWALVAANKKSQQAQAPGSSQNQSQTVASDTYKIGVILPLTGDAAAYGEPGKNIISLATDEINSTGGVNGKKLEMIYEDGKCDGQDGADAMQKLTNVDKVQVVIGGFCSSESLAAVPIAEQNKVVLLSPASSSPKLTGISHYFFRDYPSDSFQGQILAQIAKNKNWNKVAFIQEQTDYALGIYNSFTDKFQSLGGTVTKEEFPTDTQDFKTQLSKLKIGNPNVLFIDTQTPAATVRVLKQVKDLGWKVQLMVADIVAGDPQTVSDNKDLLEGTLAAEFGTDASNTKFSNLLASYKQKYGADMPFQSYGQTEYDAVYIVRDAINAVGYDGQKIADWSRNIKNWQGASGSITIQSNGDPTSGHRPEIITGGKVLPYTQ